MTFSSESRRVRSQGNGSTTVFSFTFKIFAAADLRVYKVVRATDVETLQTLTTDYTVSISTGSEGGTVTFVTAPTALQDVIIIRDLDFGQSTNLPTAGAFPESAVENALDRLAMKDVELQEQIDRCLKTDEFESDAADIVFPSPEEGKILRWADDEGTLENTDDPADSATAAAASASAASASASSASSSASSASTQASAAAASAAAAAASAAAQAVVQVVNYQTGAVATGSTFFPIDDSIPVNDEGDQFMSLAITPTNASNKLKIEVVLTGSFSLADAIGCGLFQDSTSAALAAQKHNLNSNNHTATFRFTHYMTAGTTSQTTFKVRAGGNTGGQTFTFNGGSGSRVFGGVMSSSITITEIKV